MNTQGSQELLRSPVQNPDHDPIFQKGSQIPIPIQKKDRDPDFAIFDRDPIQPCQIP